MQPPQTQTSSLHPLHYSVVRVTTYAGDIPLETATAFFVNGQRDGQLRRALVTNWHVLSGRNPMSPGSIRHRKGGLPDNIRFGLHHPQSQPGVLTMEEVTVALYDDSGKATWSQHPTRGRDVDIGVLEFSSEVTGAFNIEGVNVIAGAYDMAIDLGSDAFIIGYPYGFSPFAQTPIWKRGSIASEPHIGIGDNDRVLLDATTRQGMSGSPVVLRASTHYLSESGEVRLAPGALRWIGIYSSRPTFEVQDEGQRSHNFAEIGYFIKAGAVIETLTNRTLAADRDTVPD
jgi:hypothetical protein